jgi:hypothetical protein
MAFDQTIHEALQRLTASLHQEFDAKLKAAASELAQAAEQERQAAEAESTSRVAAQLAAAQEEANRRAADEAARARADAEQHFAEEAGRLRGELDSLRRERDELQQAMASAREAAAELDDVRGRLATAEQALEDLRQLAKATQADSERTLAELQDLRARASGEPKEGDESRAPGDEAARVQERQDKLATLDRLLAGVRRIDTASALSDVLNALADAVAGEAPRTAVLVAAAEGFRTYRISGFKETGTRVLTRAEASSLVRGLPVDPLPPDHVGFSVPIEVGNQTVALVYADDCTGEEEAVPASWPEAVEILARHAALRLSMLTALKTVRSMTAHSPAASAMVSTVGRAAAMTAPSTTEDDQSARRYARLLVSEIKLYNEATVRLGRLNRDLFERLRPEIERARTLYEQRVPAHVPGRSTYFDDELVQTLADGDPTLLGAAR